MSSRRGSKALIIDSDENVLVLRRSKTHPWVPFSSDLPGGVVEDGESFAEGLIREIKEETNIEVANSDVEHIDTTEVEVFSKRYSLQLFVVRVKSQPSVVLSFEHDQYMWTPLDDVRIVDIGFRDMVDAYKAEQQLAA